MAVRYTPKRVYRDVHWTDHRPMNGDKLVLHDPQLCWRDKMVFQCLAELLTKNPRPTQMEICKAVGDISQAGLKKSLNRLEWAGWIVCTPYTRAYNEGGGSVIYHLWYTSDFRTPKK